MSNGSAARDKVAERRANLLARIGKALGCDKRETFVADDETSGYQDALELLRLWSQLPNASDRRKVLALARRLADGRSSS